MMRALLVWVSLAVLLSPSSGRRAATGRASLSFDADGAKNRPVSKVIVLLKDMLKQLEKEAEEDEAVYDKLACWCATNDKEKTKAITDAEAKISDLTIKIEELTASSSRLNTEVKNLKKEVQANQDALDKATSIRQKQLAEFNGEEKDLLESISALKAAITVLAKHHGGSLLQSDRNNVKSVAATLAHLLRKHAALLQGVISPKQRRLVEAFAQAPQDYFDSAPAFRQSYAPQSGEIFGILRQMRETFESNLSESQKEEMSNQKAYQELKVAKEAEIGAGQAQINSKTQELADTDAKNAHAKEDIEDTRSSLSADEQFLMKLKEKCQMTDKEWEERQKARQQEMQAVSEALSVLSSDDAHDLFTRTFNPAFVQDSATKGSGRRVQAAEVLNAAGRQLHSPRLAAIAYQVRLDTFERVKKAIDDMIAQLLKEKDDEIKHRDFCTGELNTNQLQTEKKEREKQDIIATKEDLTMSIASLTDAITALKAEISEMQVQLKRAGEDREKENKDFQATLADQRETQKLLTTAIGVLKNFYAKAQSGALVQKQEPAGPPPPPGFQAYSKNAGSSSVMGLLQQIINDAKAMETEALRDESDAQQAYEDFVKQTNGSVEAKSKEIVNKSEEKAKAETDLVMAKENEQAAKLELEQLSNSNAQLHQSCDFVLTNFDVRQTARDEEVEALRQAKAILSGADFGALLQTP